MHAIHRNMVALNFLQVRQQEPLANTMSFETKQMFTQNKKNV